MKDNVKLIVVTLVLLLAQSTCFAVTEELEYYLFQDDVIEIEIPKSLKLVDTKENNIKGSIGKAYQLRSDKNKNSMISLNISYTPQLIDKLETMADENDKLGAILYNIKSHYFKNSSKNFSLYHQDEGRKMFGNIQFMTYSAYVRSNTSRDEVITQYLLLSRDKRLITIIGSAFGSNHSIAMQNVALLNSSLSTIGIRVKAKEKNQP